MSPVFYIVTVKIVASFWLFMLIPGIIKKKTSEIVSLLSFPPFGSPSYLVPPIRPFTPSLPPSLWFSVCYDMLTFMYFMDDLIVSSIQTHTYRSQSNDVYGRLVESIPPFCKFKAAKVSLLSSFRADSFKSLDVFPPVFWPKVLINLSLRHRTHFWLNLMRFCGHKCGKAASCTWILISDDVDHTHLCDNWPYVWCHSVHFY